MPVHSERQAQNNAEAHIDIQGQGEAQVRALIFDEAPIAIPTKYSNYSNIFSTEYAAKFPKHTRINNYAIKLEKSK